MARGRSRGYGAGMSEDDSEEPDVDSGPFCRHWGDPSDCAWLCTCGDRCDAHSAHDDSCRECDCLKFVDAE